MLSCAQVEETLKGALEESGQVQDEMLEAQQQLKATERELRALTQRQAVLQRQQKVGSCGGGRGREGAQKGRGGRSEGGENGAGRGCTWDGEHSGEACSMMGCRAARGLRATECWAGLGWVADIWKQA